MSAWNEFPMFERLYVLLSSSTNVMGNAVASYRHANYHMCTHTCKHTACGAHV